MSHNMHLNERSNCMRANKSTNTSIEMCLSKALWHKNIRFRKNNNKIFGTPDISIIKYKLAIFCDGDFWHGKYFNDYEFKKNKKFWDNKIRRNKERDLEVTITLRDQGWSVLRFWESDITEHLETCVAEVVAIINSKKYII